ncbi:MAG: DUF531 family protein [Candidatus Poseidoniales archaeon]
MTTTRTIVIFNQNKNKKIDEKNRRLIAKSIPLCEAYGCHLTLVNYETGKNSIEFAENMAESTSIGKSGDLFIELARKGFVRVTNLPLPQQNGEEIVCTSKPEKYKEITTDVRSKIDKNVSLLFGTDNLSNQISKDIRRKAKYHFDVSGKGIELELDTEMGAACNLLFNAKKE